MAIGSSITQHAHRPRKCLHRSSSRACAILAVAFACAAAFAFARPRTSSGATTPSTTSPSSAAGAHARPNKAPAPCLETSLSPSSYNLPRIGAATLCLLNQIRVLHHLRALRLNDELQSVAAGQALDMVVGDYFADHSLSGQTPMQRILATHYPLGAVRLFAAQNIGWATGPYATPAGIVAAWMNSPPHRAIILTGSYRDVGVGVMPAAPSSLSQGLSGATYTLEFGVRIYPAKSARLRARPVRP